MNTEINQTNETNKNGVQALSERYNKAAVIGAFIGVPAAWAISTATGFSFDNVISSIIVFGGVGLLLILKRAKETGENI